MSEIILAVIECSTNMSYIWCICAQGILFQPSLGAVLAESVLHSHGVCVTCKSRLVLSNYPLGGFSVRFFVMLKFDSKTELPCAKIWHRRVHGELDLLFKLKACEVGFWVSLGALATRIVCF